MHSHFYSAERQNKETDNREQRNERQHTGKGKKERRNEQDLTVLYRCGTKDKMKSEITVKFVELEKAGGKRASETSGSDWAVYCCVSESPFAS